VKGTEKMDDLGPATNSLSRPRSVYWLFGQHHRVDNMCGFTLLSNSRGPFEHKKKKYDRSKNCWSHFTFFTGLFFGKIDEA
jgi:hypothetical protein